MRVSRSTSWRAAIVAVVVLLGLLGSALVTRWVVDRDRTAIECPPGSDGATGPQGETGPPGAQGETGPPGAQGADGSQGAQGETGPQGPECEDGAPGPAGPAGPQGPAGAQGVAGPTGPQGATGAQGEQGPTGPQGPAGGFGAYGSFYDTGSLKLAVGTAQLIPLNTTQYSSGVTRNGSTIRIANAGKYNIAFSSQLWNRSNARRTITIWLSKDGNWLADTATDIVIGTSLSEERVVAAWNFFVDAQDGSEYALVIATNGADVELHSGTSLLTTPTSIPRIPATILTVNQVG